MSVIKCKNISKNIGTTSFFIERFINFSLFYDGAAFSYLPVLPCDFFLGAYPFACFIIEHAACGYLDVRFRKQFSFAEDKVDMIVCLAFVVVEG